MIHVGERELQNVGKMLVAKLIKKVKHEELSNQVIMYDDNVSGELVKNIFIYYIADILSLLLS